MDIFMASCAGAETSIISCDGGGNAGIWSVLNLTVNIMTGLVGILAVIGIIIFGIQYITAAGDVSKLTKAKRRLFEIIIGLAAYFLLYSIAQWLIPGGFLHHDEIAVQEISVSLNKSTIYVGESTGVNVKITPNDASNKTYSLASDNTSIASIISTSVHCITPGQTTVTVTSSNGKLASASITCAAKPTPTPTPNQTSDYTDDYSEPVVDVRIAKNKNITNVDGSTFTAHYDPKSSADYSFRITDQECNEDCSNVTSVKIDGVTLKANTDYEVRRGSIIVKIFAKTMKTLKNGDHEIAVETSDDETTVVETLVGGYLTEDEVRKYEFKTNPTYDDIVTLLRQRGIDPDSDEATAILSWVEGEGYWGLDRYLGYLSACVIINNMLSHSYGNDPLGKMASWGSYYAKGKLQIRADKAKTNQFTLRPLYLALKYLRTGITQCWGPKTKPAGVIYTGYNSKNEPIYVY